MEFILCLGLAILGVMCAVCPYVGWTLLWGWWFKNAEPSDAALVVLRIIGVLMALGGTAYVLFILLF